MSLSDSVRQIAPRWLRIADAVAVAALVSWIGIDLLGTHFFNRRPWPDSVVDFRIIYDYSRHIADKHTYPAVYPHPPAAVALESIVSRLPYPIAAGLWLLLTGAAALGTWAVLARMLGLDRRPGGMVAILAAHAASAYFFQWELRSLNNNLQFLFALVLGAAALNCGRPRRAGLWLALSISLKLYSLLILPYLLLIGRWRACGWTAIGLGVFWLLLPLAVFGADTGSVYAAWFGQVANALEAHRHHHPILISLSGSAAAMPAGPAVATIVRVLWGMALTTLVIMRVRRRAPISDTNSLLTDLGLVTLAPIAVSPYLEPYHAVPYAIPAAVLASAAIDPRRGQNVRRFACAVLVVSASLVYWPLGWEVRGLVVNIQLLTAAVGAAVISGIFRRTPALPEVPCFRFQFRPAGRRGQATDCANHLREPHCPVK